MEDRLYSFIMRGELTKVALNNAGTVSKHSASDILSQEYVSSLSLDLLNDDLVNAAKKGDTANVESLEKKWYANADEIAKFLASINPNWSEETWKNLLDDHLAMTLNEALYRLQGKYEEDIRNYDAIQKEALIMADYMAGGIIRQFEV